ncbi:MAG: 50S ribosomal protein L11 methyltransferase [Burkholderiales bacterium]
MAWLSVATTVEAHLAEPLSDALMEAGALSVEVSDADAGTAWEHPIFDEPGETQSEGWRRARVAALFAEDANVASAMTSSLGASGAPAASAYEVTRVEDEDWVRRTQAQFVPQQITPQLWVVPSWHAPPVPQAINIVLDPGMAFGTGTHPTTRLCLRWLAGAMPAGASVIDFGCGSGILAIAALKLGAARACGVDIDPQAVHAATCNAARNAVSATFVSAAGSLERPADVVVANILAQPLIVLAPMIAELNVKGGRIALSGILEPQADGVVAAYRAWYDFDPPRHEDGWVLLTATRK